MIKDTDTLYNEIKDSENIDEYLEENKTCLSKLSFSDYIQTLLKEKNLSIPDVQRRGQLTNYIYDIIKGLKMPSRNTALQLCFGFSLTPDEAQKFLRRAKTGALYPKDYRDSIIIFGLKEKLDCAEINDLLDSKGLEFISN